jgi:hypothetical protein
MPDVPQHVRRRPPEYVGPNVRVWYQPTNTRRDLPRVPASQGRQAMDAYLVSPELQDVLMEAGGDMVDDAKQIALSEGISGSGRYLSSFEARRGEIVEISDGEFANPRVSVEVENTAVTAAAVEYGNSRVGDGHRVLGQVADKYDNPRGGA